MTIEILKNLDTIAVRWVREKSREIIDYVKSTRVKRPMSTMNSIGLSRRKSN